MISIIALCHILYLSRSSTPFPLAKGLRQMEDKLGEAFMLPTRSVILDAGYGVGHVALHLTKTRGFRMEGIDVNITQSTLPKGTVTVYKMDYRHLESLADQSFDGIYTMETFVHATEPEAVLAGFYRLLRSGGRIKINQYAVIPINTRSYPGTFIQMLEDAGLQNVIIQNYSYHIRPLTRIFFILGIVPYLIIQFFGLERYFINIVAGVDMHRGHGYWRYVAISATKPDASIETSNQGNIC
ncbi:S-adenosyl-L-methionine-dependent methyltransferase [Xylariales sp. PMI_506]|nr:S-adenosyl-L-methionine-dependent methyltransferase [Xylariales sp. PMI_506]